MSSLNIKSKLMDVLSTPRPEFVLLLALLILLMMPLYIARQYQNMDEVMTIFIALLVIGLVWKFVNLIRASPAIKSGSSIGTELNRDA